MTWCKHSQDSSVANIRLDEEIWVAEKENLTDKMVNRHVNGSIGAIHFLSLLRDLANRWESPICKSILKTNESTFQ